MYYVVSKNTKKLPLYVLATGIQAPQDSVYSKDGLVNNRLMFIESGSGVLEVAGKIIDLCAGDFYFQRHGVEHKYYPHDGFFVTKWIVLNGYGAQKLFDYFNFGDFFVMSGKQFFNYFTRLNEASNEAHRGMILAELVSEVGLYRNSRSETDAVDTCVSFIKANSHRDISLDELAAVCGLSKYDLCHRFKARTSATPFEYITMCRVTRAKHLLATTDLPVYKIAADVGYHDSSYFISVFKKQEKITPREFRLISG